MSFFSSKKLKNKKLSAGFTLIEMITVIAIFVIITGIVMVNIPSFRTKSSLDLVSQEVAIQIRGAQMYAMSTLTGNDTSGIAVYGYGLKFLGGGPKREIYLNTLKPLLYLNGDVAGDVAPSSFKEKYSLPNNFVYDLGGSLWKIPPVASNQPIYIKFKRVTGEMTVSNTDTPPGYPWTFCLKIYPLNSPSTFRFVIVRPGGQILVSTTCS